MRRGPSRHTGCDTDASTIPDANSDAARGNTHTDADSAGHNPYTHTYASWRDSNANTEANSETDTKTNAVSETDAEANSVSEADAETDADSKTNSEKVPQTAKAYSS